MSHATERRRTPGEWLQLAVAATVVLAMFYPTVWMVLSAFKSNREIFAAPFGLPMDWRWENFAEAWEVGGLGELYLNSVIVTGTAVVICVGFATAAAFAFTRLEFPGRRALYRIMLIGLLLPPPVVAIPLFSLLRDLNLLNTLWALILPGAAWSLSLTVFLMSSYFNSVRPDMEEAALLDGANIWQIFLTVSVPMVWPAMLTMVILNTINIWNELIFALLFITDEDKRTLPVGLVRFYGYHSTDYALVFAALTITTIPILALYFLLQRHVIAGLTATAME
ncbi:carbohydrate ABC transporter permease [Pelagibacterium xiamenense]|uniref:carbohydrate ABC transporter permease n=1 Tax=Pelagibacterium xiamenense TaxID=2901140 RepID=UPI001E43F2C2|nr:carbohydrate ABC transporter permease [Pelagibacterium xiamenense]MCD7058780.1 carbohydrate ABC transporter permease [Pelagibacterium xiamenense]